MGRITTSLSSTEESPSWRNQCVPLLTGQLRRTRHLYSVSAGFLGELNGEVPTILALPLPAKYGVTNSVTLLHMHENPCFYFLVNHLALSYSLFNRRMFSLPLAKTSSPAVLWLYIIRPTTGSVCLSAQFTQYSVSGIARSRAVEISLSQSKHFIVWMSAST